MAAAGASDPRDAINVRGLANEVVQLIAARDNMVRFFQQMTPTAENEVARDRALAIFNGSEYVDMKNFYNQNKDAVVAFLAAPTVSIDVANQLIEQFYNPMIDRVNTARRLIYEAVNIANLFKDQRRPDQFYVVSTTEWQKMAPFSVFQSPASSAAAAAAAAGTVAPVTDVSMDEDPDPQAAAQTLEMISHLQQHATAIVGEFQTKTSGATPMHPIDAYAAVATEDLTFELLSAIRQSKSPAQTALAKNHYVYAHASLMTLVFGALDPRRGIASSSKEYADIFIKQILARPDLLAFIMQHLHDNAKRGEFSNMLTAIRDSDASGGFAGKLEASQKALLKQALDVKYVDPASAVAAGTEPRTTRVKRGAGSSTAPPTAKTAKAPPAKSTTIQSTESAIGNMLSDRLISLGFGNALENVDCGTCDAPKKSSTSEESQSPQQLETPSGDEEENVKPTAAAIASALESSIKKLEIVDEDTTDDDGSAVFVGAWIE